jgi:hypothetical protein
MPSEENENTQELPEGDVRVLTEDLPRSDQFPDSSEIKCQSEINCHALNANLQGQPYALSSFFQSMRIKYQ